MTSLRQLPEMLEFNKIEPRGVVHVGANHAQELSIYQQCGFDRMVWIEPNPILAAKLRDAGLEVVECAITSKSKPVTLYVTNKDMFSSVLRPVRFRVVRTVTVASARLDDIDTAGCNVLVVDTQGNELDVLRSGSLAQYDMLIVEASTVVRYAAQTRAPRIVNYCERRGFAVVAKIPHGIAGRLFDYVMVRAS